MDNASGKIYWTDSRTHQIYRADLDGSLLEVLIGSMEKNVSSKLGRFAHKVIKVPLPIEIKRP